MREAARLGLRVIEVDRSRAAEEIAAEMAGWFGLEEPAEVYPLRS